MLITNRSTIGISSFYLISLYFLRHFLCNVSPQLNPHTLILSYFEKTAIQTSHTVAKGIPLSD